MSTRLAAALIVSLLLLVIASAGAEEAEDRLSADSELEITMVQRTGEAVRYWPSWRGPSAQGVLPKGSEDGSYADTWSPSTFLWKVPVPGYGVSSPIIWGNFIFLTTAHDSEPVRRSIVAFRRSDGKLLWEAAAAPSSVNPESTHHKTGWAAPTASTDGERIYAYLGHDGLMAVNFEGEMIWSKDVGTTQSNYDYGVASSPLLYRDRLVLVQDNQGSGGSFIAAYEVTTGRELWTTTRPDKFGWSSPVAVRVGDDDEIVVHGTNSIRSYDPETGNELWEIPKQPSQAVSTPVVGHGLILFSHIQGSFALRPASDSVPAWETAKGKSFVPSPVLYDGHLYALKDSSGIVTCMDATSGKVLWQGRLRKVEGKSREDWNSQFSASPVALDGKVFFTRDNGDTYVVKAGTKFELSHVNRLGEAVYASPALVDGHWYIRTTEHLVAISKPGVIQRLSELWRRIWE